MIRAGFRLDLGGEGLWRGRLWLGEGSGGGLGVGVRVREVLSPMCRAETTM